MEEEAPTPAAARVRRSHPWSRRWLLLEANDEIQREVYLYLSVLELGGLSAVNRRWAAALDDDVVWDAACATVWRRKKYVARGGGHLAPREALRFSVLESASRVVDESVLTSERWWFRFTSQAGSAWTDDDPYWKGEDARELTFDDDGTLRWISGWEPPRRERDRDAAPSKSFWRLEKITRKVCRCRHFAECVCEDDDDRPVEDVSVLRVRNADFHSEFPGVKLVRHPKHWGLVFHSVWVVYANFPLRKDQPDRNISDRALARSLAEWQWSEVEDYNR